MTMHKHWMIDNADQLKTLKQQDRNKGYHTGKSAAGWNRKRHHDPKLRTANMLIAEWRVERDAIINRYRLFAYEPDFDWENFK